MDGGSRRPDDDRELREAPLGAGPAAGRNGGGRARRGHDRSRLDLRHAQRRRHLGHRRRRWSRPRCTPPSPRSGSSTSRTPAAGRTATRVAVTGFTLGDRAARPGRLVEPGEPGLPRHGERQRRGLRPQGGAGRLPVPAGPTPGDLDITAFDADAGDVIALARRARHRRRAAPDALRADPDRRYRRQAPTVRVRAADDRDHHCASTPSSQPDRGSRGPPHTTARWSATPTARARSTTSSPRLAADLLRQRDRQRRLRRRDRPHRRHVPSVCGRRQGRGCRQSRRTVSSSTTTSTPPGTWLLRVDDPFHTPVGAGTDVSYRVYPSGTTPPATYQTASPTPKGAA